MDKFAFGRAGVCYTVNDLDTAGPATGTCPPPPPPEPPPYTRTDPPIAAGKTKYLGSAWSPGTASRSFANYWNQVTPENGGKWGSRRRYARCHELGAGRRGRTHSPRRNGFPFKWHTLVWGNQQPGWIGALTPAEQLEEIHEWYAAIARALPGPRADRRGKRAAARSAAWHHQWQLHRALGGNGVTGLGLGHQVVRARAPVFPARASW